MDADSPTDAGLTDSQLAVLTALCRPISSGNRFASPATDQEIADEVFLSVDAVKGHLRTLYRRFGIEDLPHNRKRARLVELAIEGGYVRQEEPTGPMTEAERIARTRTSAPAEQPEWRRFVRPVVTSIVLIVVIAGSVLATSGIFGASSPSPKVPTPAEYGAQVGGYCELALADAPDTAGQSRAEIARGYLEVIETMRGRLQSVTPPAGTSLALERFGSGLANAANYTGAVAGRPPAAGSPAEAKDVAELTFAAGQIQAGAVGYELGHDCLAIGELVARSAENAAAP
ncbi:MAG TPA: hypothetical protein VJL81_10335 [Solirubrobacterales bacterium]|nr:hypothetical protein [Solirubrobacterales bacterium]